MSLSVNAFWNRLATLKIASPEACRKLAVSYARHHGGRPATAANSLADFLITRQVLTQYQAQAILEGRDDQLHTAGYQLLEPAGTPWQQALWGRAGSDSPRVLLQVASPLPGQAARRWVNAHLQIESPGLQPLRVLEQSQSRMILASGLPPGLLLAERLRSGPLPRSEVIRLGQQLGRALQALQQAGLAHGQVEHSRVWLGDNQSVWLLRDAAFDATDPLYGENVFLRPLAQPALFAAPEFTIPGQIADPLTDQYALGCLLYLAATGKPPFRGESTDELLVKHVQAMPKAVADAVRAAADGDPLFRLIGYMLAKNAAGRFADFEQLLAALNALTPAPANSVGTGTAPPVVAPSPSVSVPASPAPPANASPAPPANAPPAPPANAPPPVTPAGSSENSSIAPASASSSSSSLPQLPPKKVAGPAPTEATPAGKPRSLDVAVKAEGAVVTDPGPPRNQPVVADSPAAPSRVHASSVALDPANPGVAPAPAAQTVAAAKAKPGKPQRKKKKLKSRGRKKKDFRGPAIIGGLGFAGILLLVVVLGNVSQRKSDVARRTPPPVAPAPTVAPVSEPVDVAEQSGPFQVVSDAAAPWAPPGTEPPMELAMIPRGPQAILVGKPEAFQQAAGAQLSAAFSAELGEIWQTLETRTGVAREQIERMIMAFDGGPSVAMAIRLDQPVALEALMSRWQVEPARTPEGFTILVDDDDPQADVFYVRDPSAGAMVEQFAIGSLDQIKDVAELEGSVIPLPRSLETLWKSADGSADLTVMVLPNFLFADGRDFLLTYAPAIIEPLKSMLQPDVAGMLLTSTFSPQWYVEVRMVPGARTTAPVLSRRLEEVVEQWPRWAESFLIESSPDGSWRRLAVRFPQMLTAARQYARFGVSGETAIANIYLPSEAAANLTLASFLAINTPRGTIASLTPGMTAGGTSGGKPLPLTEQLELELSVSFDQESLEFAGQAVMDELKGQLPTGSEEPRYVLIGGDLEKEGITQNQQVRDFNMRQKTLREILTQLVMLANIDKSVTQPNQPEQLLVWVIGPDPNNPGQQAFLITTRAGAEGKYELPKEFVLP